MEIGVWDEKYSLNIATIDAQHRQFFHYLARMEEAVRRNRGEAEVLGTCDDLADYADTHFRDEEQLFRMTSFPEIEVQERQHRYFSMQVRAMREAYLREGKLPPESLLIFLKDWLVHHILEEDKKYAAFMAGRG